MGKFWIMTIPILIYNTVKTLHWIFPNHYDQSSNAHAYMYMYMYSNDVGPLKWLRMYDIFPRTTMALITLNFKTNSYIVFLQLCIN